MDYRADVARTKRNRARALARAARKLQELVAERDAEIRKLANKGQGPSAGLARSPAQSGAHDRWWTRSSTPSDATRTTGADGSTRRTSGRGRRKRAAVRCPLPESS